MGFGVGAGWRYAGWPGVIRGVAAVGIPYRERRRERMGQASRVGTGRVDAVKDGRLPGLELVGKGFRTAGR
jgi:hypothetical protein